MKSSCWRWRFCRTYRSDWASIWPIFYNALLAVIEKGLKINLVRLIKMGWKKINAQFGNENGGLSATQGLARVRSFNLMMWELRSKLKVEPFWIWLKLSSSLFNHKISSCELWPHMIRPCWLIKFCVTRERDSWGFYWSVCLNML